jgi:SET domain
MTTKTITASNYKTISTHPFADVLLDESTNQKSLHATMHVKKGETICIFNAGITQSYATYLTVQTELNTHITLEPEFLQYINHSCEPNVFFDTESFELIALKDVQIGNELSFFYPSTEWEMDQPFVCNCKSSNCLQLINGASFLEKSTLQKYKLTAFIKQQLNQRDSI